MRHLNKVIIDCDPGIDDAMALLLAARCENLQIIGITTVFGNADIQTTTANAIHLSSLFEINAPIHKGAAAPMHVSNDAPPTFVHGENGLGDVDHHEFLEIPEGLTAQEFITDSIVSNPNEVSVIALGRLTNLAQALERDPKIAALTKEIVIMGGVFGFSGARGNVTPCSEANIYGDPHAADLVCKAGWEKTFVGLDVTMQCRFEDSRLTRLAASARRECKYLARISEFYRDFYRSTGYPNGFPLHDPTAMAYFIDPTLFRVQSGPVRVATSGIARGETILGDSSGRPYAEEHWSEIPPSSACNAVNSDAVVDLIERLILGH